MSGWHCRTAAGAHLAAHEQHDHAALSRCAALRFAGQLRLSTSVPAWARDQTRWWSEAESTAYALRLEVGVDLCLGWALVEHQGCSS